MSHSSDIRHALLVCAVASIFSGANASPLYANDGGTFASHAERGHIYQGPLRRSSAGRAPGSWPRPAAYDDGARSRRAAHHEPKGGHVKNPTTQDEPEVATRCEPSNQGCGAHGGGPADTRDNPPAPIYSGRSNAGPPSTTPVTQEPARTPPTTLPSPSTSPTTPRICETGGTFVTIAFQPNATAMSITAFLKEYDIVMVDGPNADGTYRIKISPETVPVDQFGQMIDSMRGRTTVVASIYG